MSVGVVEFLTVAALIGLAVMDGLGRKSLCYQHDNQQRACALAALGRREKLSQRSFRNIDQGRNRKGMRLSELYINLLFLSDSVLLCAHMRSYCGGQWLCEFGVGCSREHCRSS